MLCELWEDGLYQLYVARSATFCHILWLYCGFCCVQNSYASWRSYMSFSGIPELSLIILEEILLLLCDRNQADNAVCKIRAKKPF